MSVYASCQTCAGSGRRADRSHISLRHVNDAFNLEVQADFLVASIRDPKYYVLNVICCATNFGIRMIVPNRTADTMRKMMERYWIYYFGSPRRFSADPEFTKGIMQRFLELHSIKLFRRPARASNKNGRVERQNGLFKMMLEKLDNHDKISDPDDIVARAPFLTNIFHGSKLLRSFQMAMGYTPSILGLPRTQVSQELLSAHVKLTATRALNKLLRSKLSKTVSRSLLKPGTKVYMFHRSSRHDEPVRWEDASVIKAEDHIVHCRRQSTGRESLVSYEDIRLKPEGELAQDLLLCSMNDETTEERMLSLIDELADPAEGGNSIPEWTEEHQDPEESDEDDLHIQDVIQSYPGHDGSSNHNCSQFARRPTLPAYRTGISPFITGNRSDHYRMGSTIADTNGYDSDIDGLADDFSHKVNTGEEEHSAGLHYDVSRNTIGSRQRPQEYESTYQPEDKEDANPLPTKRQKRMTWKKSLPSSTKSYSRNHDIGYTSHGRRKDIGEPDELVLNPSGAALMSSLQYELETIYEDIKHTQVNRDKLQYAPSWLLDEALRKEYEENWRDNV